MKSKSITHGLTNHPYYRNCASAITRCKPKYYQSYNYFDRGIDCFWTLTTISDFIKYLENNLPPRRPGETLNRINNNLGYHPGNLDWADRAKQNLNKRTVKEMQIENNNLTKEYNELISAQVESNENIYIGIYLM